MLRRAPVEIHRYWTISPREQSLSGGWDSSLECFGRQTRATWSFTPDQAPGADTDGDTVR